MADLYQALLPYAGEEVLPEAASDDIADDGEDTYRGPLQLAIVGRPNVGKSTLVNRLIGEERLLTGPEAGITRDAIAVDWNYRGRALRLIDYAGLPRSARLAAKPQRVAGSAPQPPIPFAPEPAGGTGGT